MPARHGMSAPRSTTSGGANENARPLALNAKAAAPNAAANPTCLLVSKGFEDFSLIFDQHPPLMIHPYLSVSLFSKHCVLEEGKQEVSQGRLQRVSGKGRTVVL